MSSETDNEFEIFANVGRLFSLEKKSAKVAPFITQQYLICFTSRDEGNEVRFPFNSKILYFDII